MILQNLKMNIPNFKFSPLMHNVQILSVTHDLKQLSHGVHIHKVHLLERGGVAQLKTYWHVWGESEGSAVSVRTLQSFFAGSLQNKSKII